ncbi:MAG: GNAT family N-acetyltransferase [Symploca sp. SIO2E9]|nr:GNAT family N-acetyltransferase [Symploca sp. SIO2E9]
MEKVVAPRLELVPFKLEIVQAAIVGNDELARILGVKVPPNWLGEDIDLIQVLPGIVNILYKYPLQKEWGWGHLVIHKGDNTLIGHITLKIIPDDQGSPTGSLEFGYIIVSSYRRQGYCTEASKAMVNWAFSQPSVQTLTAGCDTDNIASKRILEKIGMQQIETRGNVLVWKLDKNKSRGDKPLEMLI